MSLFLFRNEELYDEEILAHIAPGLDQELTVPMVSRMSRNAVARNANASLAQPSRTYADIVITQQVMNGTFITSNAIQHLVSPSRKAPESNFVLLTPDGPSPKVWVGVVNRAALRAG